jgi:predicted enzyme related to lactoylglutathione lyase
MGDRDRHEHGTLSWTDLTTPDADGAREFYGGLFPWEFEDSPIPEEAGGGVYRMARIDGRAAAAMFESQERHPAWLSYVTVDDVDAMAKRAGELGANVMGEPFDVMTAGRMVIFQDPTGAFLAMWQPKDSIGAETVNGTGRLSLNQLNTSDPPAAERFYSELFGWRFEDVSNGQGEYWGIYRGETLNGGMMPLPEEAQAPPHWLVYFGSEDVDADAEKIGSSGGTVMVPPTDVPGGRIVVAQDPQGAFFGVFAGRFDD